MTATLSLLALGMYVVVPLVGWFWYLMRWRRSLHPVAFFLVLSVAGCLLYVGSVWLVGYDLERKLYSFDLDGDREFTGAEVTREMQAAMRTWASDTGRSFAPVIALPVTLIWVSLAAGLMVGLRWLFGRVRQPSATVI